jgi:hypothetical protein
VKTPAFNLFLEFLVKPLAPFGVLSFQVWGFQDSIDDLKLYLIEGDGSSTYKTYVMCSKNYAVATDKLIALHRREGYAKVQRLNDRFGVSGDIKRASA